MHHESKTLHESIKKDTCHTALQELIYAWIWKNGPPETIESTTFIVSTLMASYHLLTSKSFGLQVTQRLCTITSQLLRTCMVQTLLFGPIHQSLLHPCVLGTQCTLVVEVGWSLEGTGSSHLWECITLAFLLWWWSCQGCASLQVVLIMKPAIYCIYPQTYQGTELVSHLLPNQGNSQKGCRPSNAQPVLGLIVVAW